MGTLTGAQIKDTYDGLLKTTDSTQGIPATSRVVIQDGVGNNSALSLGRSNNGIESSGDVKINAGNLTFTYDDQERFIKGDVNGGAIKFVGNADATDNPERGVFIGRSDNNGDFTSAMDVRTDLNVEIQNNLLTDNILAKTNSGTTGVVEFSDDVNFQNPINVFDGLQLNGDLTQNSGSIRSTAEIRGATIKATGSIGVNVSGAPSRPLDVQGNTRLFGNVLMDKSTSKLGIRRNDPQFPLDVDGMIKSKELRIGDDGGFGLKRIFTGTFNIGNQNYVQLGDYGQGNMSSRDVNTNTFQTATASYSDDGVLMEDWLYKWIRIKPSWWGVESVDGQYKEYTIFTSPNPNSFVFVDEILVIDNKDPFDPNNRRGNFVGPDDEPWLSFTNESGANLYDRQIGSVLLGTYRAENKKWAYLVRSNQNVRPNENYITTVQRSDNVVKLKARSLNSQTIRPSYNVLFRIKYKIFKPEEQLGLYPFTLQ